MHLQDRESDRASNFNVENAAQSIKSAFNFAFSWVESNPLQALYLVSNVVTLQYDVVVIPGFVIDFLWNVGSNNSNAARITHSERDDEALPRQQWSGSAASTTV